MNKAWKKRDQKAPRGWVSPPKTWRVICNKGYITNVYIFLHTHIYIYTSGSMYICRGYTWHESWNTNFWMPLSWISHHLIFLYWWIRIVKSCSVHYEQNSFISSYVIMIITNGSFWVFPDPTNPNISISARPPVPSAAKWRPRRGQRIRLTWPPAPKQLKNANLTLMHSHMV